VLVVEVVGWWDVALEPAARVVGLVAADEHDRCSLATEREQRPQLAAD
jgi:hypothetical protein